MLFLMSLSLNVLQETPDYTVKNSKKHLVHSWVILFTVILSTLSHCLKFAYIWVNSGSGWGGTQSAMNAANEN